MEAVIGNSRTAGADACVCFLNATAGSNSAGDHRSRLVGLFAALGYGTPIVTLERDGVQSAVRLALDSGCKKVIAAGGDGTVHAIANVLAGTDAALSVLPLGTLNHFARDLGISLDLEQAVRTALTGQLRSVDIGEVNGRIFVNNSSIGLYPRMVRERESLQRQGDAKWLALPRAFVGVFRRSRALRLVMKFDGRRIAARSDFVFVGNNEYQFSAQRIAARPRLNGGMLWVWHVPHAGRFRAVTAAAAALLGSNPKSPLTFSTEELVLVTRAKRLLVALDGEAMEVNTPLVYRVRPRALRVVVPPENSD